MTGTNQKAPLKFEFDGRCSRPSTTCTSDLSKADTAANPEVRFVVTFLSHTWLFSYTTTPQEPSVVTLWRRTSVLPPPIPMTEKTDGNEWTASPETVTLREALIDRT